MITITKRLEFDAGHRIPDHNSQCRNVHGHRYVLEIALQGNIINAPGESNNGMLMDFSDVKGIAKECLVDKWDHACLVYKGDVELLTALALIPGHKTVVLGTVPTAENLASIAFETLAPKYLCSFGGTLWLQSVRLFETPNCWAEVSLDEHLHRHSHKEGSSSRLVSEAAVLSTTKYW